MKKLIVALLAFGLWGCAHKPPVLKGAVNPDKLPVYPNCEEDPKQALAGADLDNAYYDKYWEFTTKDTGTGLGLLVMKKVVERHGGTLEIDSAPGRGTSVTFRFPGSVRQ